MLYDGSKHKEHNTHARRIEKPSNKPTTKPANSLQTNRQNRPTTKPANSLQTNRQNQPTNKTANSLQTTADKTDRQTDRRQ